MVHLFHKIFLFLLFGLAFSKTAFANDTIDSIHQSIKNGRTTCKTLINGYLNRIKKYNLSVSSKSPINAIVEINPFLFEEAKKLDIFYQKSHHLLGPLHCIPVIIKDNINAFDMTASSGSYALLGSHPCQDADLVSKLRKAGAIILARGTMDEFAWGMMGKSSRSGRTGNVFDTDKNPGGSSGGVAAAIAANFSLIGIGTDTTGSVLIPAAFNGVVGLRPSLGLINLNGFFQLKTLIQLLVRLPIIVKILLLHSMLLQIKMTSVFMQIILVNKI